MKIMFLITLFSFAALAGAAFAILRHIRKGAAKIAVKSGLGRRRNWTRA